MSVRTYSPGARFLMPQLNTTGKRPFLAETTRLPCASEQPQECQGGLLSMSPHRTAEERFWAKVQKTDECWIWTGHCTLNGYGIFSIVGGKITASRMAWVLVYGPIPDGFWVLHKCDNPPCVRPDHLFLGTHTDNMVDMTMKGRGRPGHPDNSGERNGRAKLTESAVQVARQMHEQGATERQLAQRFGVSAAGMHYALSGETWPNVIVGGEEHG